MQAFLKKVFLVIPIIAHFAIGATGGTDNENSKIALNSIDLVGSFKDVPMRFKLRHRVYDSTGQLWVLAWRKWSRTR